MKQYTFGRHIAISLVVLTPIVVLASLSGIENWLFYIALGFFGSRTIRTFFSNTGASVQ